MKATCCQDVPHGTLPREVDKFLGMVAVVTADGREVVGDLYAAAGGWLELMPPGQEPFIIELLPVVGIRLLTERERTQVTPKHRPAANQVARRPHNVRLLPDLEIEPPLLLGL